MPGFSLVIVSLIPGYDLVLNTNNQASAWFIHNRNYATTWYLASPASGRTQRKLGVRPRSQHRWWDRERMSLTEHRAK